MDTIQIDEQPAARRAQLEQIDNVIIRFAGDSGDGIQITGDQFTNTTALAGNDLATFPDFPAEIRAPTGTLPGVSGFQIHFSSGEVYTPGDAPDVLVVMNPAALKVNLHDLRPRGILIVNTDTFGKRDLEKAGYATNPLEDGSLTSYRVFPVSLTNLTMSALREHTSLNNKEKMRCKNFFGLGMVYWLYNRSLDPTLAFIRQKFARRPEIVEANSTVLRAGYAYCEAQEIFQVQYDVPPAKLPAGLYRNISGNVALAYGFLAAGQKLGLPVFLGSYPITPASDILHELARHKSFNVITFQAEDEIAAVCSAIGAAYTGALALTTSSGPGIALKGEAIGLAVMTELPLVVVNVQRAGPSTGMPTKTEQADLFQAMFGRNSESPCVVVAPQSPGDCFDMALQASRIAVQHMLPVILLSDGYLANGSEPWLIPDLAETPDEKVQFYTDREDFKPYLRDPRTLARPWAVPGTAGLEHRLGGLEKSEPYGHISYNNKNHHHMVLTRQQKVDKVADSLPPTEIYGQSEGEVLIVGWGGTFGAIRAAARNCQRRGLSVSQVHLRYLNPLPKDLGDILRRFKQVLVPELNLGQLSFILRAKYLVDAKGYNKVEGLPFREHELVDRVEEMLGLRTAASRPLEVPVPMDDALAGGG
jgi:2-oxoglutarate/2-oxoacid ferredoxin oxidoreductase subunit alpha